MENQEKISRDIYVASWRQIEVNFLQNIKNFEKIKQRVKHDSK